MLVGISLRIWYFAIIFVAPISLRVFISLWNKKFLYDDRFSKYFELSEVHFKMRCSFHANVPITQKETESEIYLDYRGYRSYNGKLWLYTFQIHETFAGCISPNWYKIRQFCCPIDAFAWLSLCLYFLLLYFSIEHRTNIRFEIEA